MAVSRVVVFMRLPDRASHDELQALAAVLGGVLPDAHWGPDGRVRGTAILSDTDAAAIRRWDRAHAAVVADLAQVLTNDRACKQDDL